MAAATSTDYLILERRELLDEDQQTVVAWVEAGFATHTTRMGAVSEAVGEKDGIWRPIPTRNWHQPIRTYTENEPRHRIEVMNGDPEPQPEPAV